MSSKTKSRRRRRRAHRRWIADRRAPNAAAQTLGLGVLPKRLRRYARQVHMGEYYELVRMHVDPCDYAGACEPENDGEVWFDARWIPVDAERIDLLVKWQMLERRDYADMEVVRPGRRAIKVIQELALDVRIALETFEA